MSRLIRAPNIRIFFEKSPAAKYCNENLTMVNFEYIVAGSASFLVLCIYFGIFAGFITCVIGFAYPAFATMKALEGENGKEKQTWLIYWTLYSTITLLEDYAQFIVYWIPFYYPVKAAVLIYCFWPGLQGSENLYNVIKSFLTIRTGDKVDEATNHAAIIPPQWACTACTFENPGDVLCCSVYNSPNDEDMSFSSSSPDIYIKCPRPGCAQYMETQNPGVAGRIDCPDCFFSFCSICKVRRQT